MPPLAKGAQDRNENSINKTRSGKRGVVTEPTGDHDQPIKYTAEEKEQRETGLKTAKKRTGEEQEEVPEAAS